MGDKAKKTVLAWIGEINADEVACIIIEASTGCRRPPGKTATEALDLMPVQTGPARIAAHAVLLHVADCLKNAVRPQ